METVLKITLVVTMLGIANTIYLIYHNIKGTSVLCIFFPQEWCDKVTQSKYSKTFGIPNPFLGFGVLTTILILLLLSHFFSLPLGYAKFFISFGFLFSIYFTYLQTFVIKAFCTWCVASALVFAILFVLQFFL
jgi:uncharacterized membrane protein